jgi:hypothetical protein
MFLARVCAPDTQNSAEFSTQSTHSSPMTASSVASPFDFENGHGDVLVFNVSEHLSYILAISNDEGADDLEGIKQIDFWIRTADNEENVIKLFNHLITLGLINVDPTKKETPVSVTFHVSHPDALASLISSLGIQYTKARRNGLKVQIHSTSVKSLAEVVPQKNNQCSPRLSSFILPNNDYMEISKNNEDELSMKYFIKSGHYSIHNVANISESLILKHPEMSKIFHEIQLPSDNLRFEDLVNEFELVQKYHSVLVDFNYVIDECYQGILKVFDRNFWPNTAKSLILSLVNGKTLQKFEINALCFANKDEIERSLASSDVLFSTLFDIQVAEIGSRSDGKKRYQITLARFQD